MPALDNVIGAAGRTRRSFPSGPLYWLPLDCPSSRPSRPRRSFNANFMIFDTKFHHCLIHNPSFLIQNPSFSKIHEYKIHPLQLLVLLAVCIKIHHFKYKIHHFKCKIHRFFTETFINSYLNRYLGRPCRLKAPRQLFRLLLQL